MYQRINVTLPSETLKQLDEYAPKGDAEYGNASRTQSFHP